MYGSEARIWSMAWNKPENSLVNDLKKVKYKFKLQGIEIQACRKSVQSSVKRLGKL